ncbi:MAG TPA: ChaB family protein [Solirubrobacteraceae bacterium]|nr:ChaB family protein [Solirubrobacteraceae bacterium]
MPSNKENIPSTIERSPDKVERTYEKTLDSAHDQYDDEERAHRTAWASVKNVAEKKGDHWEPKDGDGSGGSGGQTTKQELYDRAKELDIEGRSKMNKDELERAVKRES